MNPWTPVLRRVILDRIQARPGSTNIELAQHLSEVLFVWQCVGHDDLQQWKWTNEFCDGHHRGRRRWLVEEIYPHLNRMRQWGKVHSVYDHIYVTGTDGKLYAAGPDRKQHWYPGPKIPDLSDPEALRRWLDDDWSVDDERLPKPGLDTLPL